MHSASQFSLTVLFRIVKGQDSLFDHLSSTTINRIAWLSFIYPDIYLFGGLCALFCHNKSELRSLWNGGWLQCKLQNFRQLVSHDVSVGHRGSLALNNVRVGQTIFNTVQVRRRRDLRFNLGCWTRSVRVNWSRRLRLSLDCFHDPPFLPNLRIANLPQSLHCDLCRRICAAEPGRGPTRGPGDGESVRGRMAETRCERHFIHLSARPA